MGKQTGEAAGSQADAASDTDRPSRQITLSLHPETMTDLERAFPHLLDTAERARRCIRVGVEAQQARRLSIEGAGLEPPADPEARERLTLKMYEETLTDLEDAYPDASGDTSRIRNALGDGLWIRGADRMSIERG